MKRKAIRAVSYSNVHIYVFNISEHSSANASKSSCTCRLDGKNARVDLYFKVKEKSNTLTIIDQIINILTG